MGRTFSIATLLLLVAVAAVGLASLRALWVRGEIGTVTNEAAMILMTAGAMAGLIFGVGLAIWNGAGPAHRASGWLRMVGSAVCGLFLGAAAGAQFTAAVPWYGLLVLPALIIGAAALVAAGGRR